MSTVSKDLGSAPK